MINGKWCDITSDLEDCLRGVLYKSYITPVGFITWVSEFSVYY